MGFALSMGQVMVTVSYMRSARLLGFLRELNAAQPTSDLDFPVAKGLTDFCAWAHNMPVDKGPTEGTHHLQALPWDLLIALRMSPNREHGLVLWKSRHWHGSLGLGLRWCLSFES